MVVVAGSSDPGSENSDQTDVLCHDMTTTAGISRKHLHIAAKLQKKDGNKRRPRVNVFKNSQSRSVWWPPAAGIATLSSGSDISSNRGSNNNSGSDSSSSNSSSSSSSNRPVRIDGSRGEGGGQILRTAISLSAITGRPVEVTGIRAKRSNPGLRPQHMTAIKIVADLFKARAENLQVGAEWVRFAPEPAQSAKEPFLFSKGETARFDIGTAGSIPLALLTVVPAVALSGNSLRIEVTGGTDVRASPTIDYLRLVVAQAYRSIGVKFRAEVLRRGYYPKGGGVVVAEIEPCNAPCAMELLTSRSVEPQIVSVCSQLPKHVAERQTSSALAALEKKSVRCSNYTASYETAASPGSSILVYSSAQDFGPYIGGDSIGELGKRAEAVGAEAAERFLESSLAGAPVDPFLADMLVLPLSLVRGRSRYRTARATGHLRTNLQVASQMTGCRYGVLPQDDGTVVVEIENDY